MTRMRDLARLEDAVGTAASTTHGKDVTIPCPHCNNRSVEGCVGDGLCHHGKRKDEGLFYRHVELRKVVFRNRGGGGVSGHWPDAGRRPGGPEFPRAVIGAHGWQSRPADAGQKRFDGWDTGSTEGKTGETVRPATVPALRVPQTRLEMRSASSAWSPA